MIVINLDIFQKNTLGMLQEALLNLAQIL